MTTTCKDLLAQARATVPSVDAATAIAESGAAALVFVDVRDEPELVRTGKISGAVHVSRGTLEFIIDPTGASHKPVFFSGSRIVFYCTSGLRSALAARTAHDLGVADVAHLEGGIRAWIAAGGPIEPHPGT